MKMLFQKPRLIVFLFSILITSCSKSPNRILPKHSGKWNAVITTHVTSTGGYDSTSVSSTVLTFDKSGTGTYTDTSASTGNFAWSYYKNSEKINFARTGYSVIVFDVTIRKRKTEQWHTIYSEIVATDTYSTELTVDLSRAD